MAPAITYSIKGKQSIAVDMTAGTSSVHASGIRLSDDLDEGSPDGLRPAYQVEGAPIETRTRGCGVRLRAPSTMP